MTAPIQASSTGVGCSVEVENMHAENGDQIVVESAKVGSARRSGQIVEVMGGPAGEHYRVEWEDGRQSEFFPGPDAKVVPSAT
jgi:Domain of unknown function (DUF1918)